MNFICPNCHHTRTLTGAREYREQTVCAHCSMAIDDLLMSKATFIANSARIPEQETRRLTSPLRTRTAVVIRERRALKRIDVWFRMGDRECRGTSFDGGFTFVCHGLKKRVCMCCQKTVLASHMTEGLCRNCLVAAVATSRKEQTAARKKRQAA